MDVGESREGTPDDPQIIKSIPIFSNNHGMRARTNKSIQTVILPTDRVTPGHAKNSKLQQWQHCLPPHLSAPPLRLPPQHTRQQIPPCGVLPCRCSLLELLNCVKFSWCPFTRNFRSHYEKRKIGGTPSSDHNAANYNASRKKLDESLPQPPPAAEPPSSPSSPPAPAPNITATTPAAAYCNVFEASLELLQTELGVRKLFADLNLRVSEECTWSVVEAGATNTRGDEKRRTVPLEYCMQRIISNDRPRGGAQG